MHKHIGEFGAQLALTLTTHFYLNFEFESTTRESVCQTLLDSSIYQLAEDVDSPSLICSRCWDRCENWQDFRRMSQLNDARIRHKRGTAKPQIQPKRDSEEASPILLVFPKEEVPEVDDGDNDYFEDFNGDEQEAGEEEEPTEDPIGDALDCPICPDQFYNDQLYESHIRGHYIFAKVSSEASLKFKVSFMFPVSCFCFASPNPASSVPRSLPQSTAQ